MERVGEEFWDERDCEAPEDQGADRELVAGDGDEVGLESGGTAGSDDHAVGERGGPVFVAEVGEAYGGLGRERVVWRERDHESLPQQVMARGAWGATPASSCRRSRGRARRR